MGTGVLCNEDRIEDQGLKIEDRDSETVFGKKARSRTSKQIVFLGIWTIDMEHGRPVWKNRERGEFEYNQPD